MEKPEKNTHDIPSDLKEMIEKYHQKLDTDEFEIMSQKQHDVKVFFDSLMNKGIDPSKYILWHGFIKSTLSENYPHVGFDTENHDIEKFIRAIDEKYK